MIGRATNGRADKWLQLEGCEAKEMGAAKENDIQAVASRYPPPNLSIRSDARDALATRLNHVGSANEADPLPGSDPRLPIVIGPFGNKSHFVQKCAALNACCSCNVRFVSDTVSAQISCSLHPVAFVRKSAIAAPRRDEARVIVELQLLTSANWRPLGVVTPGVLPGSTTTGECYGPARPPTPLEGTLFRPVAVSSGDERRKD